MNSYLIKDSILSEVDCDGNSALHLVAEADFNWPVPGAVSQMQWEIKWYEVCIAQNSQAKEDFCLIIDSKALL